MASVLGVLGAGGAPSEGPPPLVLEFSKSVQVRAADGNWARYQVMARYEVEMGTDLHRRLGPRACDGTVVDLAALKEGQPFCIRLKYLDGRLVDGEAFYFARSVLRFSAAPPADWQVTAMIRSRAGGAEVHFSDFPGVEVASGGEEGETCEHVLMPAMPLSYEDVRSLATLRRQWEAPPFGSDYAAVCTGTMRVAVRPSGPEPEAVMWAEEYDSWLPQGGTDEEHAGGSIRVKVRLEARDRPGTPVLRAATFRFELLHVSEEPGVCLNWPPLSDAPLGTPDLGIEKGRNPGLELTDREGFEGPVGLRARTREKGSQAEIVVSSFDWGAFGELKVYADLEGGGDPLVAHLRNDRDRKVLLLPKRRNGSAPIAQRFEDEHGLSGLDPAWDEDPEPAGQASHGDALTAYEEYRGLVVLSGNGTRHVRTDPQTAELLVIDEGGLFDPTVWRAASGGGAYRLSEALVQGGGDAESSRIVDFNAGTAAAGHKYAARLLKTPGMQHPVVTPWFVFGTTLSDSTSPRGAEYSKIFVDRIDHYVRNALRERVRRAAQEPGSPEAAEMGALGLPTWLAQRALDAYANEAEVQRMVGVLTTLVTVHELGHAVGLVEHGTGGASAHAATAGVKTCPMRYHTDRDQLNLGILELLFPQAGPMPLGALRYCNTDDNCWARLRVKD